MRYVIVFLVLVYIYLPSCLLAQQEGKFIELPPNASEEELEKAVRQRIYYIDRILSGEAVRSVEEGENEKAKELLKGIKKRRALIDDLIAQRKFKEAYLALHHLHASIMDMLRVAKQEEMEKERLASDVENATIMNNALFQRVEKLLQEGEGKIEAEKLKRAKKLIETARSVRAMADMNREAEEYKDALDALRTSSKLLKKAIKLLKVETPGSTDAGPGEVQ